VDLKRLSQKSGEAGFLASLLSEEINNPNEHADAVIFAGPKVMLDERVGHYSLNQLAAVDYPVFYMNFNLNPEVNPWRDAIGRVVRRLKGHEYTISRPRDLGSAWTDIMSRITNSRLGKRNPGASQ
jgi:hypothetical protein